VREQEKRYGNRRRKRTKIAKRIGLAIADFSQDGWQICFDPNALTVIICREEPEQAIQIPISNLSFV
jgi:hypothetical protein